VPGPYRVEITATAERDLAAIHAYIAADDPEAARAWLEGLEQHAATLERFPNRCPVIPEAADLRCDYRHLMHGPYRILFRVKGRTVFVVRIFHGSKLLDVPDLGG